MRRLLFHAVVLAHHALCCVYIRTVDFSDATHSYVLDAAYRPWRFATIWNFAIQTAFFAMCVGEDLILLTSSKTWHNVQEKIRKFRSFIFAALVFPAALTVLFNFWVLFWYDRELVYPTVIDTKLPGWYNHSLHSVVALVVLVEMWVSHVVYPKRKTAMIYVNSYTGLYAVVSLVTYWVRGTWVYPLLDQLTWRQRGMLLIVQHILAMFSYLLGELINYSVWGGNKRRDKPPSKQRKAT